MYMTVSCTLLIADDVRALQTRLCLRYRLQSGIDGMTEGTQFLNHGAAEVRVEMEQRVAAEHDSEKISGTKSECAKSSQSCAVQI